MPHDLHALDLGNAPLFDFVETDVKRRTHSKSRMEEERSENYSVGEYARDPNPKSDGNAKIRS
jgi:hypothetical protein